MYITKWENILEKTPNRVLQNIRIIITNTT